MSANNANPRPSKRVRSSLERDSSPLHASPSSFSLTNLEHHPEFWFDDGNIVLVAQNTGFRIYRGLLAAQSTVFADMFASASSAADETLEGCPIVHLTDSEQDLAHLLRVLLPTSATCYRTSNPEVIRSFDEIFSVVRLAHKYYIQSIEDQELRVLQEYWLTSDFDTFFCSQKSQISMEPVHYIGAANLARLTDTPLMLPLALYRCCCLGVELLDGWTREDGTVEYLSPQDMKRCFDARLVLGRKEVLIAAHLLGVIPSERCRDRGQCITAFAEIARGVMGENPSQRIHALSGWSEVIQQFQGICEGCTEVLYERDKAERRQLWNALPQILGITIDRWGKPGGGESAGDVA